MTELLSFTLGQVKHWIQSEIKIIYNIEKHIHKPGSTAVDGNLVSIVNAAHNSVDWGMTQLPCEVPGATWDSLDHEGCPHKAGTQATGPTGDPCLTQTAGSQEGYSGQVNLA